MCGFVRKLRLAFAAGAVLIGLSSAGLAAPPSIETISKSPFILDIHASPNGSYFAAKVEKDPYAAFSVFELRDGELYPLIQAQENEEFFIEWMRWVKDDVLLVRVGRLGGRQVSVRVDGEYRRYPSAYGSALYVFNAGAESAGGQKPFWRLADRGGLVSVLPEDPDHILLQHSRGDSPPHVYRVNVRGERKWERAHRSVRNIYAWRADRNGEVRIGYGNKSNGDRVLLVKDDRAKEFRDLSRLVADVDKRFRPVAFAEKTNQIYALSNHETDTQALYLYDIETESFVEQLYHNPDFDISEVFVNSLTGALQAVRFEADQTNTVWFDDGFERELGRVKQQFAGRSVGIVSFSENASYAIFRVSAPNYPGRYYFYDRNARHLIALPEQHPRLTPERLGGQFSRNYAARDGSAIPAFITLPPGVGSLEAARNLPFIIMPHGGPAARDFARFDMWVQFYATLGYGVFQMNFRGSRGYGLSFERAGRQQWGELMQDDITDGVRWLIENEIADPDRVAIVGASYGGYAALMGAVKTPELYQCAISFAGVSDLVELIKGASRRSFVVRMVGDRFSQSEYLVENSPANRARDMTIPVMLLHGRLDTIVPYHHSEELYNRMRFHKRPVEFVTMPKSGHSFYHDYEDRVTFFSSQREYISECLGEAR